MYYVPLQSKSVRAGAEQKNKEILEYLTNNPGSIKGEVKEALGFDPTDRFQELTLNGKIRSEMDGQKRRYYVK